MKRNVFTGFLKIATRLMVVGIIISLLPTVILGVVSFGRYKKDIAEVVHANLSSVAESKAEEIASYFSELEKDVQNLAVSEDIRYPLLQQTWGGTRYRSSLEKFGAQYVSQSGYDVLLVTDETGKVIFNTQDPKLDGTVLAESDYIKGALEGQVNVSKVFMSPRKNEPVVAAAAPVWEDETQSKLLGTVALVSSQSKIVRILQSGIDKIGSTANMYLIDRDGTLLTDMLRGEYSKGAALQKKVKSWASEQAAQAVETGEAGWEVGGDYRDYSGKQVLGHVKMVKMGGNRAALVVEIDAKEAYADLLSLRRFIVILAIGVVAVSSVITVAISSSVAGPIGQAAAMMRDIAEGEGDLTKRLELTSRDELGELASWFNKFIENLHGIIKNVAESASELAATSEELSASSEESTSIASQIAETAQQIARGAQEQSQSATNTAQAVEHLAGLVQTVAEGAATQMNAVDTAAQILQESHRSLEAFAEKLSSVGAVASENAKIAARGSESIQNVVASMAKIRASNETASAMVTELLGLSQGIKDIVAVIDDIAGQTNLLALNAAIEAARAGEHGRGFAVVADEVRKLAERSMSETKSIRDLIAKVAQAIERTVATIESSTREIQAGEVTVQETGQILEEISGTAVQAQEVTQDLLRSAKELHKAVERVDEAINQIATVTAENTGTTERMAEAAEEVKRLVDNVAAVSEESAAAIEEVTASIEEMSSASNQVSSSAQVLAGTAQRLQEIVGKFKV